MPPRRSPRLLAPKGDPHPPESPNSSARPRRNASPARVSWRKPDLAQSLSTNSVFEGDNRSQPRPSTVTLSLRDRRVRRACARLPMPPQQVGRVRPVHWREGISQSYSLRSISCSLASSSASCRLRPLACRDRFHWQAAFIVRDVEPYDVPAVARSPWRP